MHGVTVLACVLMFTTKSVFAQCTPTTVESQTDYTGSWVWIPTQMEAAQTFTLGAGEGGTLDSVTVYLSQILVGDSSGTLELEIQGVSSGAPDGSALASEGPFLLTSLSRGPAGFRFATPATVNAAGSYALILRVDGNDPSNAAIQVRWAGSLGDSYAGGKALSRETGAGTWDDYDEDEVDRHFEVHVCP